MAAAYSAPRDENHLSDFATYQELTQLQSLEGLQPVDKRSLVVTNEGAEEAL